MLDFSKLKVIDKPFDKLSLEELYNILALRQEVFIVEQDCPYLDSDGKDKVSHHVFATVQETVVAYARIVPPEVSYKNYASIGRVVNHLSARSKGVGKKIMEASIKKCFELFPHHDIKISAQVYILEFYKALGFVEIGEEYLEDDIPHKAMILKKN